MAGPHILTFNFHEPYSHLLAKTGYRFTVGQFDSPPLRREWCTSFRSIPANMEIVEESAWRRDLDGGKFDLIIAHNEMNAHAVFRHRAPAILVCHNRLNFMQHRVRKDPAQELETYARLLDRLQERFNFVFISESKRDSHNIPGRVILPGVDLDEFEGYTGDTAEVIRVGNNMRERDPMFDVDFQEKVCEGLPCRVVGSDPEIPGAHPAASFDEYRQVLRSSRCLLHVTRDEWEDGYNLSLLEAMATGVPVVSLANRTSPITDGVDGFTGSDAETLRGRIRELLADEHMAREMGARARETVASKFPMDAFVENWREAIEGAIERGPSGTHLELRAEPGGDMPPRLKVLLEYVASPITTGRYFEWALRKEHEVTTAGFRFPEELLELWGFGPPPIYPAHQVDLALDAPYSDLLKRLPQRFEPGILFYVDSGRKEVPPDIDSIGFLKICYLIDTHIAPELRINIARNFDFTFLAQKAQVQDFKDAGIENVFWIPLACSLELHDLPAQDRSIDVSYIGRLADDHGERRRGLVDAVCARVPNHVRGQFYPSEMAAIYGRSKIVINASVDRDLNMRAFEAMASGALLITDEADGLEDLFEDGKHLVVYREDSDLLELVERYLADDAARERIALAGQTEVLSKHTYAHRIDQILTTAFHSLGLLGGISGESRYQLGGYFRYPRPELVPHIPKSTQRLLDVGCGGGEFGLNLKRRGLREVMGIEVVERAHEMAKKVLDDAFLGNIEEMELPFEDGYFDCIVFGDVLEHLVDPGEVLKKIKRIISPEGVVVASIPNVRYWCVVELLAGHGRWPYEDAGILDRTHLRFFTGVEMRELFESAGYEIRKLQPLSIYDSRQLERNEDGSLTIGRLTIEDVSDIEYMDFLTYQYLVVAGHPGADRLKAAREALEREEFEGAYTLAEAEEGSDEYERHLIMGRAISKLGKLDEAEAHFRSALKEKPGDSEARVSLGILLVAMNRAAEAKPILEGVDENVPAATRARLDGALGLIALVEDRPEDAFSRLKASLDEEFGNERVLKSAIELAKALGRIDEIEPLAERFADFYPGNLEMTKKYVELLIETGKDAEARGRLDTLLLLAPRDDEVRQMLEKLEEGQS